MNSSENNILSYVKSKATAHAFERASICGELGVVKHLVEQCVDVTSEAGARALERASECGQWAVVKYLVEQGVDVKSEAGAHALGRASHCGEWDVVSDLMHHGCGPSDTLLRRASKACVWGIVMQTIKADGDLTQHGLHAFAQAGEWNYFQSIIEEGLASSLAITEFVKDVFTSLENVMIGITACKARWQYQQKHGWADVGCSANSILEKAHVQGNAQYGNMVQYAIGGQQYDADISEMVQQNTNTGRSRRLRRLSVEPEEWSCPQDKATLENMLRTTCHRRSATYPQSVCDQFHKVQVVDVKLVRSLRLRQRYETAMWDLQSKHCRCQIQPSQFPCPQELLAHSVDRQLNEGFYFHGTDADTAQKILESGFDERFSTGIYGDGLYFTPHVCKALQYTPEKDGVRTVILARVLLGDAYFAKETRNGIRHAPEQEVATPGVLYDSVIAEHGNMPGAPKNVQHHTEIVIFNGAQAYPVYLMSVKV